MLSYRILAPGRRSQDPLLMAAEDYGKRLARYAKVEMVRLKESDTAGEGRSILASIAPQEHVIALDERGQNLTTQALHDTLLLKDARGQGRICLVIGGADGLCPTVEARADALWALSLLTLPHRAALMLLMEQLYRAHTMMRGEKYHRA